MRKKALVTGGAKGIGRAIVTDLAADHDVAFTYLHTTSVPDTKGHAIKADLRDPHAPSAVIDAALAALGGLDVIVHNAGVIAPAAPQEYPMAALREMFDLNVLAAQGLLSHALPHLKRGASVVSVSSVNAVLPPKGAALFGASKAALEVWTKGMAKELGPEGIRVNAVAPGAVNIPEAPRDAELTALFEEMTALGKLAEAADIAAGVRFLVSDAARAITGEVLTISGGYRL